MLMFRKMRRHKQELSAEDCTDMLINEPRGVLALLGDDDYPYAIPMSHAYADGKIYFHGAKEGHKNDAVKKYSKASYCVVDNGVKNEGEWWYTFKSVIVFGKIRILEDNNEKIEKLRLLGNKFFPMPEDTENEIERLLDRTEVYELTVEHISGKMTVEK